LVSVLFFSGVFMSMPVHVRKRGDRLKPATAAQLFYRSQRHCKNCSIALGFASVLLLSESTPTAVLNVPLVRWTTQKKAKPPFL
jgi:hypothetical protein